MSGSSDRSITIHLRGDLLVRALILALIAAMGLKLNLTRLATIKNSNGIDYLSSVQRFIRAVYLSLSADRIRVFFLAAGLAVLFYAAMSLRTERRERICTAILAAVFAVAQIFSDSFNAADEPDQVMFVINGLPVCTFRSIWRSLSYFCVAYSIVVIALAAARRLTQQPAQEDGRKWSSAGHFLQGTLITLACWMPYYIIFWPGTANEDTIIQLMEYYHIPSYIQKMSPIQGPDIFITDHHPFFYTVLFGKFTDLGLALGDLRIGIALYVLLQMIFLALMCQVAAWYLAHCGVRPRRIRFALGIWRFVPIFPMYAVCMVKDTGFAAFCLLMILLMAEVCRTHGEVLSRWWFAGLVFADSIMMMLTKKYGLYIMVIVGVFWLIAYHRHWKQILAGVLAPVLLYQFLWVGVLLPAWNVVPGGLQEALSVPFQQTARYVCLYPDEVTPGEKKAISKILPYKKIPKLYDPDLVDDLKQQYNQECTPGEHRAYFRVWAEMFRKHPGCYFAATFANTNEYFDIDKVSNLEYFDFNRYLQENPDDNPEIIHARWLAVVHPMWTRTPRYVVNQLILILQKFPVVNLMFSLGILPWIVLSLLLWNFLERRRGWNLALLIPVLTYAICLLSPDNGNSRYIMPVMYALPWLLPLELVEAGDAGQGENTGSQPVMASSQPEDEPEKSQADRGIARI